MEGKNIDIGTCKGFSFIKKRLRPFTFFKEMSLLNLFPLNYFRKQGITLMYLFVGGTIVLFLEISPPFPVYYNPPLCVSGTKKT